MHEIQKELLRRMLATGGIRADERSRPILDSLVAYEFCVPDDASATYRLTDKGQLVAGLILAPVSAAR